jgi:cyclophilin family peptidyl-prolyl cis-trans isomerase
MKTLLLVSVLSSLTAAPALVQDAGKPAAAAEPQLSPLPKQAKKDKDDAATAKDAAIVEIDKFVESDPAYAEFVKKVEEKQGNWRTQLPKPPKLTFTKDATYEWHLKTNKGEMTLKLMPDVAPMHVSSTIYLARLGFYDGLTFHRVIKGFMAQGGDPLGIGRGSPGYAYQGEFDPKVGHSKPGILSMANAGPGTDGSQFFITFGPQPSLDGKHTVFGELTSDVAVLKALEAASGPGGKTSEPLIMEATWIVVKPAAGAPSDKPAEEPKKTGDK